MALKNVLFELQEKALVLLKEKIPSNLYYHNYEHTMDVIETSERIAIAENISSEDIQILKTAAAFHDVGYIYAMENHLVRLQEDHDNAKQLAEGLTAIEGIHCNAAVVESNLIFFEIDASCGTAVQLSAAMKEQGVLIGPMGGQRMRAVTHLDVDNADIVRTLDVVRSCLGRGFAHQPTIGSGPYSK